MSKLDDFISRVELLERKFKISWEASVKLNKSYLVRGASRAILWRAKLKHPRHLAPDHVKLLDQLYLEIRKKTWTTTDPYAEALRIYKRLYRDGRRDERRLSRKDRRKLAKAEKVRNRNNLVSDFMLSPSDVIFAHIFVVHPVRRRC
jgi:hypothetical protein